MFILVVYVLGFQCVNLISSQQKVLISSDKSHPLDIEPLVINIRIPDIDICQEINNDNCKNLIDQIVKCQEIIFNDPGFSYQQYKRNIDVHKRILAKYQSMCEDIHSDYFVNESFDFKKD